MKSLSIICTYIILLLPFIAFATPLLDTEQTKCYNNTQEITCPNPGEPFYGQDGNYSINPQSYTKLDANGNDLPDDAPWPWAMVRDVTGLIWEMKQNQDSEEDYVNPHDADNYYTWYNSNPAKNGGDPGTPGDGTDTEDFINLLNSQSFGGYSDWHLPAILRLSRIVDSSIPYPGPTINTAFFPNTISDSYWSSSNYGADAGALEFLSGSAESLNKSGTACVRAVRGEQCGWGGTFIDNGDGTVTDTGTGLMWQKGTAPDRYLWQQALFYCESLSLGGHNDWRLPSEDELESLDNYNTAGSGFDPIFTYNDNGFYDYYWSSTTYADFPPYAWIVSSKGGYGGTYRKSSDPPFYVRAVRGGQCDSSGDLDSDCRIDCIDNCLSTPNGLDLGTCTKGTITQSCTSDEQCGPGGFCSMQNEDTDSDYLGDACDACTDSDKDGYGNPGFIINTCPDDNCPTVSNPTQEDTDSDSVGDVCDNCPNVSNPNQEDTDGDNIGNDCDPCPHDYDNDIDTDSLCGDVDICPTTPNPLQEDSYPPQGNSIGDACECESDFACDGDVDGTDASTFKLYFGRNPLYYPCDHINPCNGDFSCDGDVDGSDAALFKSDFGRSQFSNPCPTCTQGVPLCVYP